MTGRSLPLYRLHATPPLEAGASVCQGTTKDCYAIVNPAWVTMKNLLSYECPFVNFFRNCWWNCPSALM
jgi:hypothetical protein